METENNAQNPRPQKQEGEQSPIGQIKSSMLELVRNRDLTNRIQDLKSSDEIWLIAALCSEVIATHLGKMHGDLQNRLNQSLATQSNENIKTIIGDEIQSRLTKKIQEMSKAAIENSIGEEFAQLSEILSKSLERSADKMARSIRPADVDSDAVAHVIQRSIENALEREFARATSAIRGDIELLPRRLNTVVDGAVDQAAERATGRIKGLRDSLGWILAAAAIGFTLAGYSAGVALERGKAAQEIASIARAQAQPAQPAGAGKTNPAR